MHALVRKALWQPFAHDQAVTDNLTQIDDHFEEIAKQENQYLNYFEIA